MNSKIRVRLRFTSSPPAMRQSSIKCFMFLIDKDNISNVLDVKNCICKHFGFGSPNLISLQIGGFALLPDEDIDVIRENDEIVVNQIANLRSSEIVKRNESFELCDTQLGLYLGNDQQNVTIGDEDQCNGSSQLTCAVTEKSNVMNSSFKSSSSSLNDGNSLNDNDHSLVNRKDGAKQKVTPQPTISMKSKKDKRRKRKRNESGQNGINYVQLNNDNHQQGNDIEQVALDSIETKKKKKKVKKINKSCHESNLLKNSVDSELCNKTDQESICDEPREVAAVICNSEKQKKRKHKKRKRDQNGISLKKGQSNSVDDDDDEPCKPPAEATETVKVKNKKKRKQNSDVSTNTVQSHLTSVRAVDEACNEQSDNSIVAVVQSTNVNKTSSDESQTDQAETIEEESSMKNHNENNALSASAVSENNHLSTSSKLSVDEYTNTVTTEETNYDSLSALSWPPRAGDRVAFKIMSMAVDYTPFVTDYNEAIVLKVLGSKPSSRSIELELTKSNILTELHRGGRFDMADDDADDVIDESAFQTKTLLWTQLIEPKLLR